MDLVVKAENELSNRMHIDKAILQTWREHFAQFMRDRGGRTRVGYLLGYLQDLCAVRGQR